MYTFTLRGKLVILLLTFANEAFPELEVAEAAETPPKGEGVLAAAVPNTLPLVEAGVIEPNTEPEVEVAAAPNTEVPPPAWPPNMEDPPLPEY